MWLSASVPAAFAWALLTPLVFIGSIYICKPARVLRDEPREILRRIGVISLVCVLWSTLLIFCFSDNSREGPDFSIWLGVGLGFQAYFALASCLMIIVALFLGPLLTFAYSQEPEQGTSFDLKAVRGYIAAPIFEELIFRSCLITVLLAAGISGIFTVLISAFIFGIAHIHLLLEFPAGERLKRLPAALFQCSFTGLFGAIVGGMFWKTGSLYGPIAVHSFCNLMSVPDLSFLNAGHSAYKYRKYLLTAYLIGVAGFFVLWDYLLDPVLYQSWHYSLGSL